MKFIDRIIKPPYTYEQEIFNELKSSPYPNYIYGAGYLGYQILTLLTKNNISIGGIVVDDRYYKDGMILEDINVTSINDIVNTVNIIVAFDESINIIKDKILNNKYINKIYHLNPDTNKHLTYQFIVEKIIEFEDVYNMCEDELSKTVFCNFINSKITKDTYYLDKCVTHNIYFPDDIIHLQNDEIFIDCGAYDGDTIISFLKHTNGLYNKIYAFEPNKTNINIIKENIDKYAINNVTIFPIGLWNKKDVLRFISSNEKSQTGSFLSELENQDSKSLIISEVNVDSIDSLININENVSFIKMDIEGSELMALRGAENTIRVHKPKCAISAYHTKEDICGVPLSLKQLNPDYKIYFRQHHYVPWDMVCYAV